MNEAHLIENYFLLLEIMGSVIILWWIASTGFCGAILKLTVEYDASKNKELNVGLAGLIGIFFISLITFGVFLSWYVTKVCQSIILLLPLELVQKGQVDKVLYSLNLQFLFPTSTMVLFFVAWLWLVKQKINLNGGAK